MRISTTSDFTEYQWVLESLIEAVWEETWLIPSVGPSYGCMMDQAEIVKNLSFPAAMVLPITFPMAKEGIELGIRNFVDKSGVSALLYIKEDGYLEPVRIGAMVDDELVCGIKYAVVREETRQDDYLHELLRYIDPGIVISGIGEQPAAVHLNEFGLGGFTSGCVCVAPSRSMELLTALKENDLATAEAIRHRFRPLEDLRNVYGPILVLHTAVTLSGIADTGPLLPLMTNLDQSLSERVRAAVLDLLRYEK